MPVVGIDIGTQSLKVAVAGDDLTVLGVASRRYGLTHPMPGWAEQDPRDWERALAPAVAEALAAANLAPTDVSAVGVAGQLDGCVAVDAGGAALGRCLIWMDRRAELPALPADIGARTGQIPDPGHMAAKIRWLASHRPGAARYHQPVSYLVARLTGRDLFDPGHASTTMLYELASGDYADDLLTCFGIDRDQLPAVAPADSIAGPLTAAGAALSGLPAGLPVCVGTGDDFATPLGAGVIEPGTVACVLGTAEVVGALHPSPVIDAGALVETHAYPGGAFFVENPGWLAGGTMAWLARLFGVDFPTLDREAAEVPVGAAGAGFLPALSGAMAPRWNANARGVFHGLTPAHDRRHLARAAMESCAFAMRDVVERLRALGVAVGSILLMGGGARSRLWAQIRADATGLPVDRVARVDTCSLGAAALATVAAGIQPDLSAAAAALTGVSEHIAPDPAAAAAYDEAYHRYRALFDALEPLWGEQL